MVSCLCVTEGRPEFLPWLFWCYERQEWPGKEMVIVAGSRDRFDLPLPENVRLVRCPTGTKVAKKRNQALKEAQGEIIVWFDDDDWQHPSRLQWAVNALSAGLLFAGPRQSWFVDLHSMRAQPYRKGHSVLFNGAGFEREFAKSVRFDERKIQASDTSWLRLLERRAAGRWSGLEHEVPFFWLCHDRNISNPSTKRSFRHSLDEVKRAVGEEAWGDTSQALRQLRARLGLIDGAERASPKVSVAAPHNGNPAARALGSEESASARAESSGTLPAVSALVKATVLDVPSLKVMIPHMLRQARFPFRERVVVVDPIQSFQGKYRQRSSRSRQELDSVLEGLLQEGEIDRVIEVDYAKPRIRQVMERYFGAHWPRVPTHAMTGGPIYPTLFGLESVGSPMVAQYDADIFFSSRNVSWIEQALQLMRRRPELWLMMTHSGPPAGPPGRKGSLGRLNSRRAIWDEEAGCWLFQTASTRYFLCDRRNLHGRLRPAVRKEGSAPLEILISQALQSCGAFRGSLALEGSWDLHAYSHEAPFPEWAAEIARAVGQGLAPPSQKGEYDLDLQRPQMRKSWARLLGKDGYVNGNTKGGAASVPLPAPSGSDAFQAAASASQEPAKNGATRPAKARVVRRKSRIAPISVVIPVRDRSGPRLANALGSLRLQSAGIPAEVLVVSFGSQPAEDAALEDVCARCNASLIAFGDPRQPWCKPRALNAGIRHSDPQVPYLMTMDADMILAAGFLQEVLSQLERNPDSLVLCQSLDLPRQCDLTDGRWLPGCFGELAAKATLRGKHGTGGIQAAKRGFFFSVRGYDEDLVWWGAEDGDMVRRAQLSGLKVAWITERSSMLHQWHPKRHKALSSRPARDQASQAWIRNHRLVRQRSGQASRNPQGWGKIDGQP